MFLKNMEKVKMESHFIPIASNKLRNVLKYINKKCQFIARGVLTEHGDVGETIVIYVANKSKLRSVRKKHRNALKQEVKKQFGLVNDAFIDSKNSML